MSEISLLVTNYEKFILKIILYAIYLLLKYLLRKFIPSQIFELNK